MAVAEQISVRCVEDEHGWLCDVVVGDASGATRHAVTVSLRELDAYAPGAADPTDLVARAFGFLLAREPKESILRSFALSDIERYFPEFAEVMPPR
jgi:hypothetical protein